MADTQFQVCNNPACERWNQFVADGPAGTFCPVCSKPTRTESRTKTTGCLVSLVILTMAAAGLVCSIQYLA